MRSFSLANAPHLPVTGESHPLTKESTRWLTTGNAIALLFAMLLFGGLYAWFQDHDVTVPVVVISKPTPFDPFHGVTTHPEYGEAHAAQPFEKLRDVEPVPDAVPIDEDFVEPGDLGGTIPDDGIDIPGGSPNSGPGPFAAVPTDTFAGVFDELPQLLSIDAPVYPELPRQAGIEGTVMVKVFVTRAGKVKQAVAMEGPDVFFESAITAAKTALFAPAKQGDKPVDVWVMIPVTFRLHR